MTIRKFRSDFRLDIKDKEMLNKIMQDELRRPHKTGTKKHRRADLQSQADKKPLPMPAIHEKYKVNTGRSGTKKKVLPPKPTPDEDTPITAPLPYSLFRGQRATPITATPGVAPVTPDPLSTGVAPLSPDVRLLSPAKSPSKAMPESPSPPKKQYPEMINLFGVPRNKKGKCNTLFSIFI